MRICKRCKRELDDSNFSSARAMCYECKAKSRCEAIKKHSRKSNERCRIWYNDNRERILGEQRYAYKSDPIFHEAVCEKNKNWRDRHKERISQHDKEYREKNRNILSKKKREYYERNREAIIERSKGSRRIYYLKNKDACKKRSRDYNNKNREKRNAAAKIWRDKNHNKIKVWRKVSVMKWRVHNPAKFKAHQKLHKAVLRGKIEKPHVCEWCGKYEDNTRDIIGHHADYSKPLSVNWFCRKCHGKMHRKET